MNSSDEREDILHLTERLPNKKKTFQLVADYPLADSCMGYIVNYFEQVGRGAAGGFQVNVFKQVTYSKSYTTCFYALCGTLNSNQSKQCECVMEYPLSHFNVLI